MSTNLLQTLSGIFTANTQSLTPQDDGSSSYTPKHTSSVATRADGTIVGGNGTGTISDSFEGAINDIVNAPSDFVNDMSNKIRTVSNYLDSTAKVMSDAITSSAADATTANLAGGFADTAADVTATDSVGSAIADDAATAEIGSAAADTEGGSALTSLLSLL